MTTCVNPSPTSTNTTPFPFGYFGAYPTGGYGYPSPTGFPQGNIPSPFTPTGGNTQGFNPCGPVNNFPAFGAFNTPYTNGFGGYPIPQNPWNGYAVPTPFFSPWMTGFNGFNPGMYANTGFTNTPWNTTPSTNFNGLASPFAAYAGWNGFNTPTNFTTPWNMGQYGTPAPTPFAPAWNTTSSNVNQFNPFCNTQFAAAPTTPSFGWNPFTNGFAGWQNSTSFTGNYPTPWINTIPSGIPTNPVWSSLLNTINTLCQASSWTPAFNGFTAPTPGFFNNTGAFATPTLGGTTPWTNPITPGYFPTPAFNSFGAPTVNPFASFNTPTPWNVIPGFNTPWAPFNINPFALGFNPFFNGAAPGTNFPGTPGLSPFTAGYPTGPIPANTNGVPTTRANIKDNGEGYRNAA